MRPLIAGLLTALWLTLFTGSAFAQSDTSIVVTGVDTSEHPEVTVTVSVRQPPDLATDSVVADSFSLLEAGVERPVTVDTSTDDLEVILVLGATDDAALTELLNAAVELILALPPGASIGVVEAGTDAEVLAAPTTDRGAVLNALTEATSSPDLAQADAIDEAVELFSDSEETRRSVVTLSDAVASEDADEIAAAVAGSGTSLHSVAVVPPDGEPITELFEDEVLTTQNPAELIGLVDRVAADLSNQYQLVYTSQQTGTTELRVTLDAPGASAAVSEIAVFPATTTGPPAGQPEAGDAGEVDEGGAAEPGTAEEPGQADSAAEPGTAEAPGQTDGAAEPETADEPVSLGLWIGAAAGTIVVVLGAVALRIATRSRGGLRAFGGRALRQVQAAVAATGRAFGHTFRRMAAGGRRLGAAALAVPAAAVRALRRLAATVFASFRRAGTRARSAAGSTGRVASDLVAGVKRAGGRAGRSVARGSSRLTVGTGRIASGAATALGRAGRSIASGTGRASRSTTTALGRAARSIANGTGRAGRSIANGTGRGSRTVGTNLTRGAGAILASLQRGAVASTITPLRALTRVRRRRHKPRHQAVPRQQSVPVTAHHSPPTGRTERLSDGSRRQAPPLSGPQPASAKSRPQPEERQAEPREPPQPSTPQPRQPAPVRSQPEERRVAPRPPAPAHGRAGRAQSPFRQPGETPPIPRQPQAPRAPTPATRKPRSAPPEPAPVPDLRIVRDNGARGRKPSPVPGGLRVAGQAGLPEAEALRGALAGATVRAAWTFKSGLSEAEVERLVGLRVEAVDSDGDDVFIRFEPGGLVIHTYRGLSGSWKVFPKGMARDDSGDARWARIAIQVDDWLALCFATPVCEILSADQVAGSEAWQQLVRNREIEAANAAPRAEQRVPK